MKIKRNSRVNYSLAFLKSIINFNKLSLLLIFIFLFSISSNAYAYSYTPSKSAIKSNYYNQLPSWDQSSENLKLLINFIEDVTNPQSKNFVPEKDRIATFDMDGTILCEKPISMESALIVNRIETTFAKNKSMQKLKDVMLDYLKSTDHPDNIWDFVNYVLTETLQGLSLNEYENLIYEFQNNLHSDSGKLSKPWKEMFYQPMLELISVLQNNKFSIYIVSGSGRAVVRTCSEKLNIPFNNCIGADMQIYPSVSGKNSKMLLPDDKLLCGNARAVNDFGFLKVSHIYREIGKRPIIAFGNSDGDFSMFNYAIGNKKYKSLAMMIYHDDQKREYKYNENTDWLKMAKKFGWNVISMKNEFKKIFVK
ncbi:HAD family hydrolase [Maridesulfovibrio bastinii]|uniref:HAD family hydrolase n=1 Tax=Maridesulfovibrio bastinii TaxID=47157 RepID=UPI0004846810|nr:haloacid dehalogenase-like hydrolase [Maridesulfovibrio bastinii]